MQGTPPRRSRRSDPGNSGSGFPLIPIVLGTIAIGFVIGAGLSVVGRHGTQGLAVATASPANEATLAPATPAPAMPEPATTAPATPLPRASMHRPPSPRALAAVSNAPSRVPSTEKAPAASRAPAGSPRSPSPALPRVTARAALAPAPRETVTVPASAAPASAEPAATDDADTDFGRLAAGVVRGYLAAVARGDLASAAAALGNSSDSVTESGVVDASTRIKHVEARGAGEAATVNVDFETSSGAYFGQFTVRRSATGAAVIVAHQIIKP